jgi:hypothetical protein
VPKKRGLGLVPWSTQPFSRPRLHCLTLNHLTPCGATLEAHRQIFRTIWADHHALLIVPSDRLQRFIHVTAMHGRDTGEGTREPDEGAIAVHRARIQRGQLTLHRGFKFVTNTDMAEERELHECDKRPDSQEPENELLHSATL